MSTASAVDVRRPWWRRAFGKHPIGYLFAGPYVLFWLFLFAWPLYLAVYMSFRDWFFAAPGAEVDRPFVGFGNYVEVLSDPTVHRAALNVAIFILINVPLTVVVAMLLAAALNQALPLRTFFRAAYSVVIQRPYRLNNNQKYRPSG